MIEINGNKIQFDKFPNGETKPEDIRKYLQGPICNIRFKFEDDSDLIKLMFVKNFLDDMPMFLQVTLEVMYMPYSRMDRVDGATTFTLKYVSKLINNLGFHAVVVSEPHSDVTCALLDRSYAKETTRRLFQIVTRNREIPFDPTKDYVCLPDAGAQKSYGKMGNYNFLVGYKDRDFESGWIKKLEVYGDTDLKGANVIIVDDLCSKGGTFILTAKKLKAMGAGDIFLVVAHCENSIHAGDIFKTDFIKKVFTTNSIYSDLVTTNNLKVYTNPEV